MRPIHAGLVLAASAMTALTGCSEARDVEPPPGDARPTSVETTVETCAAVIPDAVFEALGWTAASAAELDIDTCTRQAEEGTVTVQRRAVPAVGGDDLPAAAEEAFTERCEELAATPEGATGLWEDGQGACARVPEHGRAISMLVLHTASDAVVEMRVDATAATEPARREAAFQELSAAAATTF